MFLSISILHPFQKKKIKIYFKFHFLLYHRSFFYRFSLRYMRIWKMCFPPKYISITRGQEVCGRSENFPIKCVYVGGKSIRWLLNFIFRCINRIITIEHSTNRAQDDCLISLKMSLLQCCFSKVLLHVLTK